MAVNKVIVNNETRLDLTADTVSPSVLFEGYTAHDASGQAIVGTASQSGVLVSDTLDTNGGTIRTISVADAFASSYKNISSNGTYNASSDNLDGYSQVIVNVPSEAPTLQTKTVSYTPSETQQASTVTADNGYDGLNKVNITVEAIPSTYVGSGVNRKTSSDLTASGATITAPAGYYAAAATKSVASGSAQTPATTLTINPSIAVNSSGLITVSASTLKAITPTVTAGYVSSGTAGTVTVSVSNISQLSTQASTTIAPTESTQTAVASGKYTTGDVKIGAIPTTYIGSGVAQKSSSDLTVSGATVTAPVGYYAVAATKSVASGTAGTPTATKGTVSNHSIAVTPSVTNTTGYITGGTKTGTVVTVSASELVSGTKTVTENGTGIDVTNYASVDVDVESDDFVITLSYNNSTEKWEPDCTYAEAYAAYQAGKNIVFTEENNEICKGLYQPSSNYFEYFIDVVNYDGSRNLKTIEYAHYWSSSSISDPDITEYYYTGYADAVSANVLSGKKFFNGDGYQVGTATSRSSSDLTASGATVTAPAGFYSAAATKSVASGSAQTPNTTISVTPTISVNSSGLITVSASTTRNITPTVTAGYVSSGTAGTVTVSGSNTSQLSAQAATTYNVSSSNQTISSGKYLTGNQTIRGVTVSGLAASSIANGVTVKIGDAADDDRITSVTGTLSFATYYTGSSAPSSSLGVNGDIYLQN